MSVVYTIIGTLIDAKSIARRAIEEKLAFCANIVSDGISIYRWEGEIHEAAEYFVFLKTSKKMREALASWLAENHPYTVPVIIDADVMANSAYVQEMTSELS